MQKRFPTFAAILFIAAATLSAATLWSAPVWGGGISLIRDAEIESTIRTYATPLFSAAGLDPKSVKIYLVADKQTNAFVAGGMNLFINTGLLLAVETPEEVVGVIAHEVGHIAGGHLARTQDALRGASAVQIIGLVLGAAAAAAGSLEGAAALIVGSGGVATTNYLKYSRTQEQAADQFAATTLEQTGQSAQGLRAFLETLEDQQLLLVSRQDPYLQTHPLTRERISFLDNHLAESRYSDARLPDEWYVMFDRMQAKLYGFLRPPGDTLLRYPESDTSVVARYARSIAHYLRPDLKLALAEVDSLIAEAPNDPYFHELRGQILFENGKITESIEPYRRAVELRPDSPLLMVGLSRALIETNDPAATVEATEFLKLVVREDASNVTAWRLLSISYGRSGEFDLSTLASAEYALLRGRYRDAIRFSERASDMMPYGSPGQLRAEDIAYAAKNAMAKRK